MSRQHLKKILNDHHLKLWACGLGILLAMSLAAATPPLTKNSVAAGPTTPKFRGASAYLVMGEHSGPVTSAPVPVQGTVVTAAASTASPAMPAANDTAPVPLPVYPDVNKCPMLEGSNAVMTTCGGHCVDSSYQCACYGRGTELMCIMPE